MSAVTYEADNRSGQRCIPVKYKDGYYRFAVYVQGDQSWKLAKRYILIPEPMLDWAMSQRGWYIRMKVEKCVKGGYELFRVESCRRAAAPIAA